VERWKDTVSARPQGCKTKKMSHKELIRKWTRDGGKFGPPRKVWSKSDIDRNRTACRTAEQEQIQSEIDRNRLQHSAGVESSEEEEETDSMLFKASDLARARMAEMAEEMQMQVLQDQDNVGDDGEVADLNSSTCAGASPEELQTLADCRRSQLEELEMLEAMFPDELCPLYDATVMDKLRASLDVEGAEAMRSVVAHPPFGMLFQMTVPDERSPAETGGKQLVASVLLHVVFPPMYLTTGTPPLFHIQDVLISDAQEEIGLDKVLLPEVNFDSEALVAEMKQQAADMQPDPCVHAAVSWMTENVFSYAP